MSPIHAAPAMAAKRRKRKAGKKRKGKKRKLSSAHLKALQAGRKRYLQGLKGHKRKPKKTRKRKTHKKPANRKRRKLTAAHLAKMLSAKRAKAAHLRKHGPPLTAKVGERARSRFALGPPTGRMHHPIRHNPPRGAWWKFIVRKSGYVPREAVGYGTRHEAETKARKFAENAYKVDLLGPYTTRKVAVYAEAA